MDSKQAAETLRELSVKEIGDNTYLNADDEQAVLRGADAIEMLGWLFIKRDLSFNICWCIHEWVEDQDFYAFCEAKFKESRNGTP